MGATSIVLDGSAVLMKVFPRTGVAPALFGARGRIRGPIYSHAAGQQRRSFAVPTVGIALAGRWWARRWRVFVHHAICVYCPAASDPRVRGSGAPSRPFGVTAIEFADVWPSGSITAWPLAFNAASVSSGKPRSTRTSSGIH